MIKPRWITFYSFKTAFGVQLHINCKKILNKIVKKKLKKQKKYGEVKLSFPINSTFHDVEVC